MNLIKFKDTIKTDDETFNTTFKGRYCWWINCNWAVVLSDMSYTDYISASQANIIPTGIVYISTADYTDYVDEEATERINNQYNIGSLLNKYATDSDITLSLLRIFRTWLAQSLIDLAADTDEYQDVDSGGYGYVIDTMLNYYANGMYDDTIQALQAFSSATQVQKTTSSCGCSGTVSSSSTSATTIVKTTTGCGCGSTSVSSLGTSSCDSVASYKASIKSVMVSTFSNIDFWIPKGEFCIIFKHVIDNIIKSGLSLSTTVNDQTYCDCCCTSDVDTTLTGYLNSLSTALQYIIDGDTANHKNFIYTSLYNWALNLYENMYWA